MLLHFPEESEEPRILALRFFLVELLVSRNDVLTYCTMKYKEFIVNKAKSRRFLVLGYKTVRKPC
jgi:hypothetical protein